MPRFVFFAASLRKHSWNRKLLEYLQESWLTHIEVDWLEPSQLDWPLFNQDLENEPRTLQRVMAVHRRIQDCQAMVVASPEYNGMVSPFLKNTVDWLSRLPRLNHQVPNAFLDKPILLCSASTGSSAGRLGLESARSLFAYLGANVMGRTINLPHVQSAWDAELGWCIPPEEDSWMSQTLSQFCGLAFRD